MVKKLLVGALTALVVISCGKAKGGGGGGATTKVTPTGVSALVETQKVRVDGSNPPVVVGFSHKVLNAGGGLSNLNRDDALNKVLTTSMLCKNGNAVLSDGANTYYFFDAQKKEIRLLGRTGAGGGILNLGGVRAFSSLGGSGFLLAFCDGEYVFTNECSLGKCQSSSSQKLVAFANKGMLYVVPAPKGVKTFRFWQSGNLSKSINLNFNNPPTNLMVRDSGNFSYVVVWNNKELWFGSYSHATSTLRSLKAVNAPAGANFQFVVLDGSGNLYYVLSNNLNQVVGITNVGTQLTQNLGVGLNVNALIPLSDGVAIWDGASWHTWKAVSGATLTTLTATSTLAQALNLCLVSFGNEATNTMFCFDPATPNNELAIINSTTSATLLNPDNQATPNFLSFGGSTGGLVFLKDLNNRWVRCDLINKSCTTLKNVSTLDTNVFSQGPQIAISAGRTYVVDLINDQVLYDFTISPLFVWGASLDSTKLLNLSPEPGSLCDRVGLFNAVETQSATNSSGTWQVSGVKRVVIFKDSQPPSECLSKVLSVW